MPGYLNAATLGLPTRGVVATMDHAVQTWASGRRRPWATTTTWPAAGSCTPGWSGCPTSWVATGARRSAMVSLVAAALPDGAEVVVPDGDFTSVVFPFLVHADRGVRVRHVPLAGLADAIGPSTTAVAFSLAQSADGVVADADAVREAAGPARRADLVRHDPGRGLDAL